MLPAQTKNKPSRTSIISTKTQKIGTEILRAAGISMSHTPKRNECS